MLWLQYKTRRSQSPHISCVRNGSPSVEWSVGQLPSLRRHTTYNTGSDLFSTTVAQVSPTLPQTAHYARQTTYNTGSDLSHFTSDRTVRQANYLQQWLRSPPLYLRLHSTAVTENVPCYSNHGLFRRRHPHNVYISLHPSFDTL